MSYSRLLFIAFLPLAACATAGDNGGNDAGAGGFADARPLTDAGGLPDAKVRIDAAPGTPDAAPQQTTCTEDIAIACNQIATHALVSSDPSIGGYTCQEFGTEMVDDIYQFTRATAGMVTLDLDVIFDVPLFGDDMDLYVLQGTCATTSCMTQSANAGDEQLSFMAAAGETYYIVVEAFQISLIGDYDLTVTCP